MVNHALRVAIVGGGIGGLATAHALLRQDVEVRVYEQAPQLGEVGAGVQIAPNGLRVLKALGVSDEVEAVGSQLRKGSRYYRTDGTVVADSVTTDSSGWNGLYGVHRADLLDVLARALPDDLVQVGRCCVGFEQDAHTARLSFDDGSTAEADVVIGADGIHSVLRNVVARPSPPVHSGSTAYRGLVAASDLPDWPKNRWEMWMGDGKHFLVFPVRSGTLLNYVGFVPSAEHMKESWSAPGDSTQLAAEFAGWDPRVERLLLIITTTFWWGLYDREPLATWTSGRLTLLGDAAHPMLPHLGQGTNQALEDAAALGILLGQSNPDDAPQALRSYEDLRRRRTTQVQEGSRTNGLRYDSAYENLSRRDAEIAAAAEFRWWVYDYDVQAAVSTLGDTV